MCAGATLFGRQSHVQLPRAVCEVIVGVARVCVRACVHARVRACAHACAKVSLGKRALEGTPAYADWQAMRASLCGRHQHAREHRRTNTPTF